MKYVVNLERDSNGSVLVTCPEVPEFSSVGDNEVEALMEAVDGMVTALSLYIDERRPFPLPRAAKAGEHTVRLPAQATAKAYLHNEMLAQDITKAELGRRLGLHDPQVARLLDPLHSTKLEALEHAIEALDRHLEVCVA